MKKIIYSLIVALVLGTFTFGLFLFTPKAQAACGSGYSFCRTITVDHTQNPATQTNFTVLASTTLATLKTVANGGNVQNTTTFNGQTAPADLVFSSTADCSTLMSWDIDHYVATTGEIEAWILVPSLSSSVNTTITMCYGKSSVTTYQGGSVGAAWDTSYTGIWHFPNGTTASGSDYSTTGATASINGTTSGTQGVIDGSVLYHGGGSGNDVTVTNYAGSEFSTGDFTLSGWFKNAETGAFSCILGKDAPGDTNFYILWVRSDDLMHMQTTGAIANGTTNVHDGLWHYAVGTRVGTLVSVYVDGALQGTSTDSSNLSIGVDLGIGVRGGGANFGQFGSGSVDEARVSKGLGRSANWITAEYNNQKFASTMVTFGAEQPASSVIVQVTAVSINNGAVAIPKGAVAIPGN